MQFSNFDARRVPDPKKNCRNMVAAAATFLALAVVPVSGGDKIHLHTVGRGMLCVTEGTLQEAPNQRFAVNVPKMRAYVNRQTSQSIQADFTYFGPTENQSKLGSGEMRRQVGLKLRAQDPCNLVYAMWRIEPESKLVVSVKANPGQHTSAECANGGYRNIKPLRSSPVPVLRPGDTHSLRAEMDGENLRVFADSVLAWEGTLGRNILSVDGPVGIRSDNARLEIQLQIGEHPGAHGDVVIPCKSGPAESE